MTATIVMVTMTTILGPASHEFRPLRNMVDRIAEARAANLQHRAARVETRVAYRRPVAFVIPQAVLPAPVPVVPKAIPQPMPSVKAAGNLEERMAKVEKAMSDAGRSLLFRNEGGVTVFTPPPVSGYTVYKPATTVRVVRPTTGVVLTAPASSCPGGVCPTSPTGDVRGFLRLRFR